MYSDRHVPLTDPASESRLDGFSLVTRTQSIGSKWDWNQLTATFQDMRREKTTGEIFVGLYVRSNFSILIILRDLNELMFSATDLTLPSFDLLLVSLLHQSK